MEGVTAPTAPRASRSPADRCPGLLRPHAAADGALLRLRLPGGHITPDALTAVSAAAVDFGDGRVQLTSRGNLQLRGVQVDARGDVADELVDRISAAGLLPSPEHELVRNIVCSPLTGRIGGLADLRPVVTELDQLLCRTPELAALPARFLFGLDDGRGDIAGLTTDLGVRAVSPDRAAIVVGAVPGPVVDLHTAARRLVALAIQFLLAKAEVGGAVWHVRDLPDAGALLDQEQAGPPDDHSPGPGEQPNPGMWTQADGRSLLSLVVPLALLDPGQVRAVVAGAENEVIVTPWRGLIIPDLTHQILETATSLTSAGFSLDSRSGWSQLSACTGAPGCSNGGAPTRPVAAGIADAIGGTAGLPVHVVACERRCGAPSADHLEVLVGSATAQLELRSRGAGHRVGPGWGEITEISLLASTVAQARNGL